MNNLTVLCCVGALIGLLFLFVISLILRNLFGRQATPASGSQSGSIEPTYNDPNIQGHGSFGRIVSSLPGRRSSKSGSAPSGHVDSDSVQGRGSFGRDKKD